MKKRVIGVMLSAMLVIGSFSPVRASEIQDVQEAPVIEEVGSELNKDLVEEIVRSDLNDSVQIGDNVYVSFNDDAGTATISGTGATWNFLPDGMDQITGKRKNPFSGKTFNYITIEDGVTGIGDYLFYSGGPTDDTVSQSYIRIKSINLPNTLITLGECSFAKVKDLKQITLPESVREIGNNCFMFLEDLETVGLNEGLQIIGDYAFYYTHVRNVVIPSSVIRLGTGIFKDCRRLLNVEILSDLKVVPNEMFSQSSITTFDFEGVEEIGAEAFGSSKLSSVDLPNTVKYIGDSAFRDCYDITEIRIPDSVTCIETYAFANCLNLKEIAFSTSMSVLSSEILQNCTQLTCIVIPENIKEIQSNAFRRCTRLQTVSIPEGAEFEWRDDDLNPFGECNGLKEIIGYSGSCAEKFANDKGIAFTSLGLKKIKVGDNVYAVIDGDKIVFSGSGATYDFGYESDNTWLDYEILPKIKRVDVGENITRLGDGLFSFYRNLSIVNLPSTLESIGEYTFAYCRNIEGINIPINVKTIGKYAFADSGLEEIEWPSNTIFIKEGTFMGCTNLNELVLPNTVKEIEIYALAYTGLRDIVLPELVSNVAKSTFEGSNKLVKITFPEQIREINEQAFMGCTELSEIYIPKSVIYIGPDAFRNCRKLMLQGYKDSLVERYAIANSIQFQSIDYRVVFKNNGKTVKTEYVIKNGNATPPTLTKEGFILSWDGDYTDVREDMTINAVWTPIGDIPPGPQPPVVTPEPDIIKYTVTFVDRGKKIKSEKVIKGGEAEYPYVFRYGYELSWDGDCNNITENKTITAVWKIISPEQVENLKVLSKGLRVCLSWDEAEYASRYQILRKSAKEKTYEVLGLTGKTVFNDYKTEPGMGYYYKVVASRSVAGKPYNSRDSKVVKVLKDLKLPTKMSIKRITKVSNSSTAQLSMNTSANASGYYIYCYDRKVKKNLLTYKIVGEKVYKYNSTTGKYKFISNASIKNGKLSCKLIKIDLKKYASYSYRIRAYSTIPGFGNQRTAVSEKFYLKR